jgi:hypothetical protein
MPNVTAWLIPLSLVRFDPSDSAQVDQERRLGSEYYNDEVSYEFSERSDREWNASLSGYRVTAGSFNMSEFYFCENIQLRTARERGTRLNFSSNRYQSLINDKIDREIRFEQRLSESGVYWSLMADGDSVKSFADLGTGVAFESNHLEMKIDYWSIDHFYNTKTLTEPDRYDKPVYAIEWELAVKSGYGHFNVLGKDHSPIEWQRPSRDLNYQWQENFQSFAWQSPQIDQQQIRIALSNVVKTEKLHEQLNSAPFKKSLDHRYSVAGAEWIKSVPNSEDLKLGVRSWYRRAEYEYEGNLPDGEKPELIEPDVMRRELALYLTRYRYFGSGSGIQLGLHWNHVRRERDVSTTDRESKLQTAYDWRLADNANMFWNFTWDLDQLARNFPYSHKPFRPWGGGNIQMNILF